MAHSSLAKTKGAVNAGQLIGYHNSERGQKSLNTAATAAKNNVAAFSLALEVFGGNLC